MANQYDIIQGNQKIRDEAMRLLQMLTEAHGAPGFEDSVREIFRREAGLPIITDNTGSMYTVRNGTAEDPVIMICGHLDEVGFIVHSVTSEGFLKFLPLGGWWGHVLPSHRVRIKTQSGEEVVGLITAKPYHFLSVEEKEKVLPIDKMYIDVGAADAGDVVDNLGISPGDPVVPEAAFTSMHHQDLLMGKAFDCRAGICLALQAAGLIKPSDHPNQLYFGGNAQEEVGTRGAQTAANRIKPDAAIVLEGTPGDDLPGFDKDERQAVLGNGIQIRVMDAGAILNIKFTRFMKNLAASLGIPHQIAVRKSGATDARVIHLQLEGIPCVVLGVPARYIHTHNSIIHLNDYLSGLALLLEAVKRLDADTAKSFTEW